MGILQVPEQVRRAPLLALRAAFAGIGRVLMVADRPAPVVVVEEGPAAQPAPSPAPGTGQAQRVALARERAADLPLPHYDALSLASIRARLRGLDVAQLKVMLDYEAANAERAEVLGMFERRIQKLEAGA